MKRFVDRETEMETLKKEYTREGSSFVVIYGRRRVGKTALINEFCKDKKALFFLATEENERENRENFKNNVAGFCSNDLLANSKVDKWESIFDVLVEYSKENKEKTILVIDEFQYLGKANKAFPSIMMSIWDRKLKDHNVMLIVCGSLINMMTTQVLSYDSPLYGRRTAQMRIGQIPFTYYQEFFPELSEDQCILRYAVTGGVPKYIELFQDNEDIYEAIRENIMSRNAFLYAEPEFLLQKEVSEIGNYFSLLKTIAAGNHKLGKIATVMEMPQTSLTKYLKVLSELDIVERQVPVTEENPEKSKKGLYDIKDNFLKFWFRFIYPYREMLEAGQEEYVMEKIKTSFIDNHVSYIYEDICRSKVWCLNGQGLEFNRVGRWWDNSDVEIDMVAYNSTGKDILFGECKYSVNPKGIEVLRSLQTKAGAVTWNRDSRNEQYVLFSRSGYTEELLEYAQNNKNVWLL
jgi:hypothetical protein